MDVDKLEEILRVEEASSHAIAQARERAEVSLRTAREDAVTILADGQTAADAEAASLRESLLADARSRAVTIAGEGESALQANQAAAEQRLSQAVHAALEELAE